VVPLPWHLDRLRAQRYPAQPPAGARPFQADSRLFASYWLAAAAVFWATRHSARAARLVGLDVALVDIPFAFLLQWTVVLRNPAISAVPLAGTIFFMLLVLAAAFSLEAWRIVLAAAVGAAAEVWRGPHRGVHQGRRRAHPGVR